MTTVEIFESKFSAVAIIDGKAETEADIVEHIGCLMRNLEHDLLHPSQVLGVDYWGERLNAYCQALQAVRDIKARKDKAND